MASAFAEKRQDTLNRFYTRTAVGELLVDQLGDFEPRNVLDLGAGEGSLSAAVVGRWQGVEAVTVDLDPGIVEQLHHSIEDAGAKLHRHHVRDVLDPMLPVGLTNDGPFDLAVCNPPFFRPSWNRDYARILQQADLADACPSTADATAEILFLAQNLRMVRDDGKIALIAPDGLLTGWRTTAFRRAIMDRHAVDCILQLPNHSFHDTEARCFILIITKNAGPSDAIKLLRYDADTGLSAPIMVSREDAEARMDFDFHAHRGDHAGRLATLRQLGAEIRRGSLDTIARKAATYPTFHTTDYRGIENGSVVLDIDPGLPENEKLIVAEAGDILMARVDRNLHEKVAIVESGRAAVTDCIYRVRVPAEVRASVFDALRSPVGTASLRAATKGVSARLLGKADLLDLPLRLPA
ncbi:type I restriction enzyme M protein [Sphingomonas vulcanisoli]|uniref:Type I restriction enzyme M protein n=1 Tax=Sphingomonas vulcanisoli TaxID=1658060 RepID=A0ABX0TVI8_9SPHN|nr:N-6 DNA methylase [Sphingomonas vulcanisoli]NIJ07616.1 type I restriction enzyme M protein [Sphingomonas vulcanisoli]